MIKSLKKIFGIPNDHFILKKKYKHSGLTEELGQYLNTKLIELMINDKVYTDCELSLDKLANYLGTTRHNTSQIINQYHNKSYSDFINDFRIDDAKEFILRVKNINISKLMFDLGYNSKSNFYDAFKKRTNLTPTQYKSKHSTISGNQ